MLCFAFGQNGEVISGDSNGNIFIWGNGKFQRGVLFGKSCKTLGKMQQLAGPTFYLVWITRL